MQCLFVIKKYVMFMCKIVYTPVHSNYIHVDYILYFVDINLAKHPCFLVFQK